LTALFGVQAVDQTADSRPHRRGEIRHGELDDAANLAVAFAGKRGRQQGCLRDSSRISISRCSALGVRSTQPATGT
jgi:hypothetical protein